MELNSELPIEQPQDQAEVVPEGQNIPTLDENGNAAPEPTIEQPVEDGIIDPNSGEEQAIVDPVIDEEQQAKDIQAMDTGLQQEDPYAEGLPEEQLAAAAISKTVWNAIKTSKPAQGIKELSEARVVRSIAASKSAINNAKIKVEESRVEAIQTIVTELRAKQESGKPLTPEEERTLIKGEQKLDAGQQQKQILEARSEKFDDEDPWQYNFDTITDNESVKATIAEMAEMNKDEVMATRGGDETGVQTNEETKKLADMLNIEEGSLSEFLNSETNDLIDPEHILYARQFIEQSGERLYDMSVASRDGVTFMDANGKEMSGAELDLAFVRQSILHQEMYRGLKGKIANFGRSMQAMKIPASNRSQEIDELLAKVNLNYNMEEFKKEILATSGDAGQVTSILDVWMSAKGQATDMAISTFVNSILSNPFTHVVNGTGGVIKIVAKSGEDFISSVSQMGEIKVRTMLGQEVDPNVERYLDEVVAGWMGGIAHLNDSWDYGMRALMHEELYGGVTVGGGTSDKKLFDAGDYVDNPQMAWALNLVPKTARFMSTRVMGGMDAYMRSFAERQELYKNSYVNYRKFIDQNPNATEEEAFQYMRNNIIAPTDEELEAAAHKGLVATYSNVPDNMLFEVATAIGKHPMGQLIMPFKRAPINIMDDVIYNYNPASLAYSGKEQDRMFGSDMEERHRLLARYTMGTAFATYVLSAYAEGKFEGTLGDNWDARSARREAGHRNFSYTWKDENGKKQSIHFKRLDPISTILESLITFADTFSRKQEITDDDTKFADKYADAIVRAFNEATLERSSLKGIRDIMNVFKEPERYADSYLNNLGNSFIPLSGLRRFAKYQQDPYIRKADDILGTMRANTPFLYTKQYPLVNSLGDPVMKDDSQTFTPWVIVEETDNPVLLEQARLAESVQMQALGRVKNMIGTLKLNVQQHYELTQISRKEITVDGNNYEGVIKDTIESEEYKELTDFYKVTVLKQITSSFDKAARTVWLKRNPDFFRRIAKISLGRDAEQIAKNEGTPTGEAQNAIMTQVDEIIAEAEAEGYQPLDF